MPALHNRWTQSQSYSQWVGAAVARARTGKAAICTLFDSSVPEPRELLRQIIAEGITPEFSKYFTSAFGDGNPFMLDTIARAYGVERAQVLATTGATGGIALAMRTFASPGDHVLVETPGFDLFHDIAERQSLIPEAFRRVGSRFQLDLAKLESQIRPDTRFIILSNLHNPSGMAIEHPVMEALARMAERRDILVIVDEVYGGYADKAARPCDAAALSPNMISVSSLTKLYGLGALRCGWIVGSQPVMEAIRDVSARTEFGVSSITHAIGAHVFERQHVFDDYFRSVLADARPVFDDWFALAQAEGLVAGDMPAAGAICFPELPGIVDTRSFSDWLTASAGVIVAPGECFGAPGHIRIGFAKAVSDLEPALAALSEGIRRFRDGQAVEQFSRGSPAAGNRYPPR